MTALRGVLAGWLAGGTAYFPGNLDSPAIRAVAGRVRYGSDGG